MTPLVSAPPFPAEDYARVFAVEQAQVYPSIDAIEARTGYALDRARLEGAARVLACPVKAHPPNWQHGRVIYALTRAYLATRRPDDLACLLDIGTAKGFSALCLLWAAQDAGVTATVTSLDVLDPEARVPRNTVAECDGLRTLAELLAPWPESDRIAFLHMPGIDWLVKHAADRVHVAFVDGRHKYDIVRREGLLLSRRQRPGDLAIFDDLQIEGVDLAVRSLAPAYRLERVTVHGHRAAMVAVRQ